MRDEYSRITPDFEAWEKLGYKLVEIHEDTYTLSNRPGDPLDFIEIVAEYDTNYTGGKPDYSKEEYSYPSSKLVAFTSEEQEQINKDIKNWEEETKLLEDFIK